MNNMQRQAQIALMVFGAMTLAFVLGMVIASFWVRANPCLFAHPFTAEMMGCP